MSELINKLELAKNASYTIKNLSQAEKNRVLESMASMILDNKEYIKNENKTDVLNARENGMKESMIDRLVLNDERIDSIVSGIRKVISLTDPVGEITSMWERPNGIRIGRKRVPIGVIGIIYEARPNVTVDAAVLCLKTSNVTVLKGGKEAIKTNIALVKIMQEALKKEGLPENAVSIIEDTQRETTIEFMKQNNYLDVLIPRGGQGLIKAVVENATVPVIETGTGNCHVYIDKYYDKEKAINITINGKVQRPSVCNALESIVVHKDVAEEFLPVICELLKEKNVIIKGCQKTLEIVDDIEKASEEDFYKEYNDLIISVKVVDNIDDAIMHINKCSTGHSETIITENYTNAEKFLNEVDSACVYVNASTRFTDGFEFGFGAEIGISTQKLHARGPLGLNELTTNKYVIYGNGQVRG